MLNFGIKELVDSYAFSDMNDDRHFIKRELVNGRRYDKHGIYAATTMVIDVWKVWDPSVKHSKFVYVGGVARQHPMDLKINKEMGLEIAHEHAMVDPSFRFEFEMQVPEDVVVELASAYVAGLPKRFLKTAKEITAMHKVSNKKNIH